MVSVDCEPALGKLGKQGLSRCGDGVVRPGGKGVCREGGGLGVRGLRVKSWGRLQFSVRAGHVKERDGGRAHDTERRGNMI